jgi:hypothetical protein
MIENYVMQAENHPVPIPTTSKQHGFHQGAFLQIKRFSQKVVRYQLRLFPIATFHLLKLHRPPLFDALQHPPVSFAKPGPQSLMPTCHYL